MKKMFYGSGIQTCSSKAPSGVPVVSELQLTVYRLPSATVRISPSTHGLRLDVGLGCCPLLEAEVEVRLWDSLGLNELDKVTD